MHGKTLRPLIILIQLKIFRPLTTLKPLHIEGPWHHGRLEDHWRSFFHFIFNISKLILTPLLATSTKQIDWDFETAYQHLQQSIDMNIMYNVMNFSRSYWQTNEDERKRCTLEWIILNNEINKELVSIPTIND